MLVLTRKKDEKIMIGNKIVVTVVEVEGGQVQLGIDAPGDIDIYREEVYKRVKVENIKAAGEKLDITSLGEIEINEEEGSN